MKNISPTYMYIIPMYLRLTTFTKTLPLYIFLLFLFRSGAPPMTLLTAGALTDPQLPAQVQTCARLMQGWVASAVCPPPTKSSFFFSRLCAGQRFMLHYRTLEVRPGRIYIIREEASIFAPQRIPFYKDPRVAACTVGKVRSSTVFMCVCSTFRPSDFLLYVKNGFVVGVRCQGNREPPADSATTPLSH